MKRFEILSVFQLAFSILYFQTGKKIKLKQKSAGITNLLLSIPVIAGLIFFRYGVAPIGIGLCLMMNLLIVVNWKFFESMDSIREKTADGGSCL